jgi:GNAT superfamily N-acetyltransferase
VRTFTLSYAQASDLGTLVSHRQKMWLDIHPELSEEVRESEELVRRWIKKRLSSKNLIGFIVRARDGEVAGSGCIWIREEQPRPTNSRLEAPYLMSMYTEEKFRRRGVAKMVVKAAIGWARDHGYERLVLHASSEGRPLYEGLGFQPSSEMRIRLGR